MFQHEKLKRNAIPAIAEVAQRVICSSNCALPNQAKSKVLILHFFSGCDTIPTPPSNSVTIPATASTMMYLADDLIMYSCNGALVPNSPVTVTCTDTGAALAEWIGALPTCSKLNMSCNILASDFCFEFCYFIRKQLSGGLRGIGKVKIFFLRYCTVQCT